jgi:hypothetical protein
MQVGDVPEPLCDPQEHSTDVNNEFDLGSGNNQLTVCHTLHVECYWDGKVQHTHLVLHCTDEAQLGRNSCLHAVAYTFEGPCYHWQWRFVLWNLLAIYSLAGFRTICSWHVIHFFFALPR